MKYTLYKVKNTKSQIRGYWLDKGKLYKDNINLVNYNRRDKLKEGIRALFKEGQKAVFYSYNGRGYCINKEGKMQVYHNRLLFKRSKISIKEVKGILEKYKGLTIFDNRQKSGFYLLEVYGA